MQLGVCADPKFAPVLADAGFDFIELHVQNHLKTLADEVTFAPELSRIQSAPLPAIAANCFLPGSHKVVGPMVDRAALEGYVSTVFVRAGQAGISTIVFGSGGARTIPDDFDRDMAWEQLVAFGKLCGALAQPHDVTVVVEPLNVTQGACNVLTSVGESARYVEAVDHPNVRLLADSFHWGLDGDSYDDLVAYGHLLHHVHVATVASRFPIGFEPCAAQEPFFAALKAAGYDGPISIEARWEDMASQAADAYVQLREMVSGV